MPMHHFWEMIKTTIPNIITRISNSLLHHLIPNKWDYQLAKLIIMSPKNITVLTEKVIFNFQMPRNFIYRSNQFNEMLVEKKQ